MHMNGMKSVKKFKYTKSDTKEIQKNFNVAKPGKSK